MSKVSSAVTFTSQDAIEYASFVKRGYKASTGVDVMGNTTIIVEYATLPIHELDAKQATDKGNKSFASLKGRVQGVELHGMQVAGSCSLWVKA